MGVFCILDAKMMYVFLCTSRCSNVCVCVCGCEGRGGGDLKTEHWPHPQINLAGSFSKNDMHAC